MVYYLVEHAPSPYLHRYSGGVIISLTYGYKLTDPAAAALVKDISGLADTASAVLVPGAYLVSIVPALRHIPSWLPGGAFHKVVGDCKAKTRKLCEITYRFTKEKLERSWAHPEEEGLDAGGPNDRDADLKLTPGESMVEQWLKAADVQDTPTMDGIEAGLGSLIGGVSQEVIIQDTALTVFVAGYDTVSPSFSFKLLTLMRISKTGNVVSIYSRRQRYLGLLSQWQSTQKSKRKHKIRCALCLVRTRCQRSKIVHRCLTSKLYTWKHFDGGPQPLWGCLTLCQKTMFIKVILSLPGQ